MASATITVTDDDQWIISAAAGEDHESVERDFGDLAWLTISRSADPNLTSGSASDTRYEIAVDFVLSGGAVRGTDYDLLCGQSVITSNTVSIPEDETSVSLAIRPKNDAVKEDDTSVTLTITGARSSGVFDSGGSGCCCACWGAGGDFPVDENAGSASVTILDDDHWLITLEESGTPGSPRTVIAEEQTTAVNLTLKRTHDVMTPSRTGDTTYPIDVEFDYAGSKASGGDYVMIHNDVEYGGGTVSFTIQKDKESETIQLKAVDDTYVEYLHELLKITAKNAIHGEQAYQVVTPDTVEIDIEDNDEFELHWAEFEDHLGMIADPSSGLDYSGHHWLDNNRNGVIEPAEGDKKLPVAYQSGNPVKETARFAGIIDPTYSGETLTFSASMSADPGGGAAGPPAPLGYRTFNVTAGSGEVVLSSVELTTLAANTARHFDDFNVVWLFQFAAEPQLWRGAGAQENDLYATYQGALTGQYHTVIHLGCDGANGESTDTGVMDGIWAQFSDRQVKTVKVTVPETDPATPEDEKSAGDMALWYYKDWLADEQSTVALLTPKTGAAYGDGTCNAWVDLLLDVMKAQGLDGGMRKIKPKTEDLHGIAVKNWNLTNENIRPGQFSFQHCTLPQTLKDQVVSVNIGQWILTSSSYQWYPNTTLGADPKTGIPGQGENANPASFFAAHLVAERVSDDGASGYTVQWYDPSYGGDIYTGSASTLENARTIVRNAFVDRCIAAVWVQNILSFDESKLVSSSGTLSVDLNEDGDTDDGVEKSTTFFMVDSAANPTFLKDSIEDVEYP